MRYEEVCWDEKRMFESDYEKRHRLRHIWRTLIGRLSDSEFPMGMVYETLSDIAIEGLTEAHGVLGAVYILRLQINAMEEAEKKRTLDLLNGETES